ncbi:MAG: 2-hydroxyacid dehydrogenase [Clostridiales bacterium]|nr:2-hydroxyacid dehydrogenase [Clostridiales bacterium]
MKVAFFDTKSYDRTVFDPKFKASKIKVKYYDSRLDEDDAVLAKGCDAVCVFVNDTVNAKVIDKLAEFGVKVIALRCAGFNNVDIPYANSKGITVVRVPAYSPYAVAEHAMALLLTINRKIHRAYIRTRDFNFSLAGLEGFDLHGKTVGVIGTGKIGRVFIDICKGFGMKVIAYDKFPDRRSKIDYRTLDEVYAEADILSFHCPLTEDTLHMFNLGSINKVKPGVTIINTSRGALIDANALLKGIKQHKIRAAALDVYEEEGDYFYQDLSGNIIDDDTLSMLISMPNVIVTSHQAFLTSEALENIATTTVSNIKEVVGGEKCANEIRI